MNIYQEVSQISLVNTVMNVAGTEHILNSIHRAEGLARSDVTISYLRYSEEMDCWLPSIGLSGGDNSTIVIEFSGYPAPGNQRKDA